MRIRQLARWVVTIGFTVAVAVALVFVRDFWATTETTVESPQASRQPTEEPRMLKLTPQARANLGLVSKPVELQSYWRTIQVPGVVVDRPGRSDRAVTAPAEGVVARVYAAPGDTLKPGDRLFMLRLSSEYVQNVQSEFVKALREQQLANEQRARLDGLAKDGIIPGSRIIEIDSQLRRVKATIDGHRQDLLSRGFSPQQIDGLTDGTFVLTIDVVVPSPTNDTTRPTMEITPAAFLAGDGQHDGPIYELEDLKVGLGQQVQAGQLMCLLANHQALYIEGHAFKQEAPSLEQAAQSGWPVRVEFAEEAVNHWLPLEENFQIRHLSNAIDQVSRTFDFYVPLTNQSKAYEKDGKIFVVWRFRPGQRVRLLVPVEEFKDVIVLPAAAVARDGPEAYVFRQNGDLFDRQPVHVLHEDRQNIVLANDGSVTPGTYLANGSAASLNRVLKAQNSSGGLPPGFHVHADGSVHIPGAR